MPTENAVSIKIAPADLTKILEAYAIINATMSPYLIALSPEQREQLPKMGDKTLPFVQKALEYAQTNPQFAPAYMNVAELKIDVEAVSDLTQVYRPTEQLCSKLDDTIMLAGSEAYIMALAYYNSVKQGAKMNIPGAKSIYDDLSKRFANKSAKSDTKATK